MRQQNLPQPHKKRKSSESDIKSHFEIIKKSLLINRFYEKVRNLKWTYIKNIVKLKLVNKFKLGEEDDEKKCCYLP